MNNLEREGAILLAKLGPDPRRAQAMDAGGNFIAPLPVRMMIDTGAEMSLVSERFVRALDLRCVGDMTITGISQRPEVHQVYLATLHMPAEEPEPQLVMIPLRVASMRENIGRSQFDGLLGRSFLAAFNFAYAGTTDSFAEQDTPLVLGGS
ncbi:MAG: retroviral-like aspartic protease family protein [Deltaproteobacteria bacterium]|nr:retroviral-like aspartic protease family protein [Deltaproteobacteria bacterium]